MIETKTCNQAGGRSVVEYKSDHSQSGEGSSGEAIRHFCVPNNELPLTFRLLCVQGLPPWANTSCVSIDDVIQVTGIMVLILQVIFPSCYFPEMMFC